MTDEYICIECTHPVKDLYTFYGEHNVRLTQCQNCKNFADKYVEFDGVITIIDLILCKRQVYRHLLFNRLGSKDDKLDKTVIRMGLMMLLFDVYLTWARVERAWELMGGVDLANKPAIIQYTHFLIICMTQTFLFHSIIRILSRIWLNWQKPNAVSTALLISSSVKLLPILMVIWAYDVPVASRIVGWAVLLNNMEALVILLNCSYFKAATMTLIGAASQYLLSYSATSVPRLLETFT